MKTILVSGASGIVGYGTLKSLRNYDPEIKLIGTSIYDDSVAPAFCDSFEKAPITGDNHYIDWLCEIIRKHSVDMIIPGIEIDMFKWNKEREKIVEAGALPLLNNPALIDLCEDKWLFYSTLKETDSRLAIESSLEGDFNSLQERFGLPFLLKPRKGFASKGIVIVDSEEVFLKSSDSLGSLLMAQPIVGSAEEEYTVSAFLDQDSNLLCFMGLRRKLAKEGFTEKAEVFDVPGAKEAIEELSKLFKPVGPTNFQFRMHGGRLKLLEINPRISSATSIRTAFGYNESMMSVEYFLENNLPKQPVVKRGYAVRYTEEHVFYDSNTV